MIPRKKILSFCALLIFNGFVDESTSTKRTTDKNDEQIYTFEAFNTSSEYYGATTETSRTTKIVCEDPPRSVQNLTVSNKSHSSITVTWTYGTSIDCISYFRVNYSGGDRIVEEIIYANETALAYVISNLTSCTTYSIAVIAVGRNESSSSPQNVSTTTDETRISQVNLTVVPIDYGLMISWDPPKEVSCLKEYNVTARTLDNEIISTSVLSSQTSNYTFSDLSACTKYVVEVIPVSTNGTSGEEATTDGEPLPALPGVIRNLTVQEKTGYSVYLTWLVPTENAACVSNYAIDACVETNCKTKFTTDVFYNVTNLNPCITYRFTVGATGTTGSAETLKTSADTTYVAPGKPNSLKMIPGQFSMYLHWTPPLTGATCTTSYRITLYENGDTKSTSDTNITFSELYACKSYTAQVTSLSGNLDGALETVTGIIEPSVEEPPVLDEEPWSIKNTITIGWRMERKMNNCTLKTLTTSCNFTSTNGHGIEPRNETTTISIENLNSTRITVLNLSPFSFYTCYGYTTNSAGDSRETTVTAKTSEDIPSAPSMTASNITNDSMIFGWERPDYLPGNLIEHEIHFSWEQLFLTPSSCNYGNLSQSISGIEGARRVYSYSNATPYSIYNAKIRAKTNAGWGSYSDYISFQTEAGVPGAVRDIKYSTPPSNDNTNVLDTWLDWRLPCSSNGKIESFKLHVYGTRYKFDDHELHEVYIVQPNISADDQFSFNFEELKAEYNYTFKISAKVAGVSEHGMSNSYNAIYPAGIPPMPNDTYMKTLEIDAYAAERSKSSVTVLLPLFKDTNGNVKYYAIMISKFGHNLYNSSRFDGRNGIWPKFATWKESMASDMTVTYQATETWWDPAATGHIERYKNFDAVKFTLGENDTCSKLMTTESYCNGPLIPDTMYQIRMRAFTTGGYSDSRVFIARTKAELNLSLVIGVVFGILFLGIITTMMLLVRKGSLRAIIRNPGAQTSPVPDPLTRKKFEVHCQDLITNPGKLSNEFQLLHTLSVDLQMSTNDALLQANRKKNRYLDILPYDISRVKLDLLDNDPNTDYINASFIHGYTGAVEYIACQGPKEETTYDFWRMVFQYNVKVIVMVTQLIEKDKEKCHQYYPNMRENFEYEDLTIRCSTQLDFVFYTQRNIVLQMEDTKRTVIHLHFKEWSDHGVPDDFHSMLHFCQTVRKHMNDNKGVAVIHCSAGVGRTGTLITIDILLQHIRDNKKLDVFGTVFNLRKDRINMVQTESQYAYIYNCTRQALNNPYSLKNDKASSIEPIYDNLTKNRKEIIDSNTNLVNSAETLKKISPSSSIDSMEPIYEVVRQRPSYSTQFSTLSNGLRYTKSTGAIDHPISPGVEIVRYGSHEYPIFEPAPDTLSNRGSVDRNTLLRLTTRPSRTRLG